MGATVAVEVSGHASLKVADVSMSTAECIVASQTSCSVQTCRRSIVIRDQSPRDYRFCSKRKGLIITPRSIPPSGALCADRSRQEPVEKLNDDGES